MKSKEALLIHETLHELGLIDNRIQQAPGFKDYDYNKELQRMTRVDKILIYTIISTALAAAIMLVAFVSPRPPAIRNQMQVVHLLSRAHPEFIEEGKVRIERVVLGNGLVLWPEHDQAAAGYIFKAHVESSEFTVEAQPMKFGGTGVFSYFRDSTGVL